MFKLYSSFDSLSDLDAGFLESKSSGSSNDDQHCHFLDSCSLCKKSLAQGSDVYMYRGDVPFCSEECREEQMQMDEASERKFRSSIKLAKEKRLSKSRSSTTNSVDMHIRGTVIAA
ncbi:uncharacterized protein M6B38_403920 [Iris pallida]|uniref:FLZ-type domain-containing protein n=1 Tax=Iris pallida TaxID=29817 RepID=A0AAX6FS35_IRIPA|nr:uncharacterized protein M6B38_403920 [Iris pallida]